MQRSEGSLKPGSAPLPVASDRTLPAAGAQSAGAFRSQTDAPPCHYCGSIMTRNGSCYRCANCGSTSGCS